MAPNPRTIDSVDTPSLLIDLDRLQHNLREMADLCRSHGKALRPHVKSHKMVEVAAQQIALGATGLTVAKLGEAEVFAAGGFDDLLICFPVVGKLKLTRLVELARHARVSTIVDDAAAMQALAAAARAEGVSIDVLVKLDVGMHRVGVSGEQVDRVAHATAEADGISLKGVCIHEGDVYAEPDPRRRRKLARERVAAMVEIADRLRGAGLPIDVVSSGATPAVRDVIDMEGLTEVRPGNYVFYDAMQAALGVVPLDRCALSVLTTVVSHADPQRAIIDAGAKALTLDRGVHGLQLLNGYGEPKAGEGVEIVALSEEHGWLRVQGECEIAIGDRLEIVPNHACPVANSFETARVIRDGNVYAEWKVAARGQMA